MNTKSRFPLCPGWLVLLFLVLACTGRAVAQDFRGKLTGVVSDTTGAAIPNVSVTAVNDETGQTYRSRTTGQGVFFIPYVIPGSYTLTAEATGFVKVAQKDVRVLTAQTFNQNFTLKAGGANEEMVVTAQPPDIESTTASNNTVLTEKVLSAVPLNGGNVFALLGTTPGSQFNPPGPSGRNSPFDSSNNNIVGGGVTGNNLFTLNGVNITSQYYYGNHQSGQWNVVPNQESVSELNVQTTTYDARYGRTSGGIVNTVTKGGTNAYHGTLRYAYQGSFLNANTFQNNLQNQPRGKYVQNQYWATFGGPIIRDHLQFFVAYDGFRNSVNRTYLQNVAPAFLRPGYNGNSGVDFSLVQQLDPQEFPNGIQIFQPGTAYCTTGGDVQTCNNNNVAQLPFAGDQIPGNLITPNALAVLKYIPLPNVPGSLNSVRGLNYFARVPSTLTYGQPQGRLDYSLNDRTKFYSYVLYWNGNGYDNFNGLPGVAAHGQPNHYKESWLATQDVTHVFSPTLLLDVKLSFNRLYDSNPDGAQGGSNDPSQIGLTLPLPGNTSTRLFPEYNIGDQYGVGFLSNRTSSDYQIFGNLTNADTTNNYTLDVDLTKTAGAHNLEFGGAVSIFQYGGIPNGGGNANGEFDFNSTWTQFNPRNGNCLGDPGNCQAFGSANANGSSLASFYLGYPSGGHIDWNNSLFDYYPVYSVYMQDNWRATPKLSLNLGLRYDVQVGTRERHNRLNRGFCTDCVNPITNDPTYQANIANPVNQAAWRAAGIDPASLAVVKGGIQYQGKDQPSAYDTDYSGVGPRFGFAYAPVPTIVIRGGYGIIYSYGLEGGNSYQSVSTSYNTTNDGGNTPTALYRSGNPFPSGLVTPPTSAAGLLANVGIGTQFSDFPTRKIPLEQVFSMGLQQEFPGRVVLDARFAANYTQRLRTFLWVNGTATLDQQNQAIANPQYYDARVPNPFAGVAAMSGGGRCGDSSTIQAVALRLPLSQYCGGGGGAGLVAEFDSPRGRNWYNGLEVKLTKRTNHGLVYNLAYTWSKTMEANHYQNGWPYQDAHAKHEISSIDRTHVFSGTVVYDLPFGRGGQFLANANPVVNALIGEWTLSSVFNAESGQPVSLPTSDNLLCPGLNYRSPLGTSVRQGHWFNTQRQANGSSCWSGFGAYQLGYLTNNTNQVRTPTIPTFDLSLQKGVHLSERLDMSLRLDAFNALNSVLFGGPDTNPFDPAPYYTPGTGWQGFGTVPFQQQNNPRVLQLTGRLSF